MAGREVEVQELMRSSCPVDQPPSHLKQEPICSYVACDLHQPTVPAGKPGELINRLQ